MRKRLLTKGLRFAAACASLTCISAYATTVRITVENLFPDDSLWFSPVFLGFHDGSFDYFDAGTAASSAVEAIAEQGNPSGLVNEISGVAGSKSAVLKRIDGSGPPDAIFAPGTSNWFDINLDPTSNRFLSFGSMVVPSNDAFFGNDDPMAHALFDGSGNFNDGFQIDLFGYDIWDAGTELNDPSRGAAFTLDTTMGTDVTTMDNIMQHSGLENFVGAHLPVGGTLGSAFSANQPIARISAQKVPDATPYIGLMSALGLVGFRFVTRRRMGTAEA